MPAPRFSKAFLAGAAGVLAAAWWGRRQRAARAPGQPAPTGTGARSPDTMTGFAATPSPRGIIRQAESDLERGLEDTDCRGAPLAERPRR